MMQVVKQARPEKIAMYMRLPKRELAELLVNSNMVLEALSERQPFHPVPVMDRSTTWGSWPFGAN